MNNKLPVTIAIVDDHELVRQTFNFRLTLLGYKVVMEAENGKAFLEKLAESTPPDICLLDINMPVMDGFETAKHLKKKWPGIKILFFSIHNEPAYISKANLIGGYGFLAKDASSEEIMKTLFNVTNKKKMA
jgi:DNA-binding NarL/FixJ family response regulator